MPAKKNSNGDNKVLYPVPKVGDTIYVDSRYYLSRGCDDFDGGLATVKKVIVEKHGKRTVHGIVVEEDPSTTLYWENDLGWRQEELREEFKSSRAKKNPDLRPEFNTGD